MQRMLLTELPRYISPGAPDGATMRHKFAYRIKWWKKNNCFNADTGRTQKVCAFSQYGAILYLVGRGRL